MGGHASSVLDEAGLVIKVVDGMEDRPGMPWRASSVDHVSASLVNRQIPFVYSDEVGTEANANVGLVLSSDMRFECAMTSDSGSIGAYHGRCDMATCGEGWGVRICACAEFH